MQQVARVRPFDLEWLRTALPKREGTDYLGLFRDNILYYPPVGSPAGHSFTVLDILQRQNWKPNFDDTDLTQTTDGVVPYAHALVATERYRQIHWCNKKLYLEMMETLLQNYIYLSGVVRASVNPKSRTSVERQIGQNRAQILKGLQRDQLNLTGSYGANYASRNGPWKKDYGNIKGDTPASKTRWLIDVISKLSVNVAGCQMLMERGCTMEALVFALDGLYTEWQRDNSRPFPYVEASPQAMLFIKRCYLPPHEQPKVVFDRRSVISRVNIENKQKINYIRIEPTIGASNKFVVFEKDNWLGFSMSEPPETRSKILAVLVAYNFFDTAKQWVETWGEPDPAPVTYNVIADPKKYSDLARQVPDLANVFDAQTGSVMLTVAQTKQLVKELTGNCPDFKATDDVHPTANMNPGRAKESVYKAPPGEGEVVGESESGPARGGIEEPDSDDDTRIQKELEETYASKVTTIPQTKEQKKAAADEANGNWMLLALAALGVVAFNMR